MSLYATPATACWQTRAVTAFRCRGVGGPTTCRVLLSRPALPGRPGRRGGGVHLRRVLAGDGLMDYGYAVHLRNTTAIPRFDGQHDNDDSDALHGE